MRAVGEASGRLYWTAAMVGERFREAADVLMRLPSADGGQRLPDVLLQYFEQGASRQARPGAPDPQAIDRAAEVLDQWKPMLDGDEQRIVMHWAFEQPMWQLVDRYRRNESTIRRWRRAALEFIAADLNGKGKPVVLPPPR